MNLANVKQKMFYFTVLEWKDTTRKLIMSGVIRNIATKCLDDFRMYCPVKTANNNHG